MTRFRRSHQKGYVYKKGRVWYLRYYDCELLADGRVHRVQRCRSLIPAADPTLSKDAVLEIAHEFLAPLNSRTYTPYSSMSLNRFVEEVYMPYVADQKEQSTNISYRNVWKRYVEPRGSVRLRDLRTFEIEMMLREISHDCDLSKKTLQNIKNFLSGAIRYACRTGVLSSANPVRDAEVPKGRSSQETHASSLEDILGYLNVVAEPLATVIAVAAMPSECRIQPKFSQL